MSAPNQHDHLFYFKSKFCNFSTSELVEADTLIQPITSGDFNVSLNGIDVDEQNKIIYFQGKIPKIQFSKKNYGSELVF